MQSPTVNQVEQFEKQVLDNIERLGADQALARDSLAWMIRAGTSGSYLYNFRWMGRPIIQYPQDVMAMQELVWRVRPDLIIETGIAHGGSLVMSASLLALLDMCDAIEAGVTLDPRLSKRRVVGVDIDIRTHNRAAIAAHPMASRIGMIEGSSTAPHVVDEVRRIAGEYRRVLVCLDSNHSHEHVLAELYAYATLTTPGSYCVVFDTLVEDMPAELCAGRPWGPGNSPRTAVQEFLQSHPEFEIDSEMRAKLQITVAPDGYLRRIK